MKNIFKNLIYLILSTILSPTHIIKLKKNKILEDNDNRLLEADPYLREWISTITPCI
jgi:hypothetical protein